jgi:hypothetical protein
MVGMNSKLFSMVTVFCFVFPLVFFGFQRVRFVYAVPEFSPSEIYAVIKIISPIDNGSYTGDVQLNISITFSAFSSGPNMGVIPYQKISCLYRVDGGEWKNASLVHTSGQQGFWNPPNANYWNLVRCNYSALLQGLSNGAHVLDITLKPDGIDYFRVDGGYRALKPTVIFHVFGNEPPAPTTQTENSLITATLMATIIAISAPLIFRKIRKSYSN